MRFVLAALGLYALYRFVRKPSPRGPRALLTDMHKQQRGNADAESDVTYEVVEHDGGWAYKVGDVFSESFATQEEATQAAEQAAAAHRSAGAETIIESQDRLGRWHEELEPGEARPQTHVQPGPATER